MNVLRGPYRFALKPFLLRSEMNNSAIILFWSRVAKAGPEDCWNWLGGKDSHGYGLIEISGVRYGAHRLAWSLINGDIERDKYILHSCDNPSCCNPAHLRPGTHAENMKDKVSHGRSKPECIFGECHKNAKLLESDVREIRSIVGLRQKDIGVLYGVSQATVWHILHRSYWPKVA